MNATNCHPSRTHVDFQQGSIVATLEFPVSSKRAFEALASEEIIQWWVRPGVFDTRQWKGQVHAGGRWEARGAARGQPYVIEGEFVEVQVPRKLVHTWRVVGAPETTVTYIIEDLGAGSRITLRHGPYPSADMCANTAAGWQTSFDHLAAYLNDLRGN